MLPGVSGHAAQLKSPSAVPRAMASFAPREDQSGMKTMIERDVVSKSSFAILIAFQLTASGCSLDVFPVGRVSRPLEC